VATGSYQTGAATAVVSSLVNTQFTYLDVGVEIEIYTDRSLRPGRNPEDQDVSSQGNGSTNIGGITEPIISQRTADQVVRLKEGEVNILGGFLQKQDLQSIGGTPYLGELPILKYLFSSNSHEIRDDEIIFHADPACGARHRDQPLNLQEIDTGTGTNVELRRISAPAGAQPGGVGGCPLACSPMRRNHPRLERRALPALQCCESEFRYGPAKHQLPFQRAANTMGLQIAPPQTAPKVGGTFQVAVKLSGGQDVFSVPMQLHYDTASWR